MMYETRGVSGLELRDVANRRLGPRVARMQRSLFFITALVGFALCAGASEPATNRFGFTGREIFPIDNGIAQLKAVDLNGDGKMDLVVVNNARSKINLLINRTGETNRPSSRPPRRELNDLPPDARFRIESIASEKRI